MVMQTHAITDLEVGLHVQESWTISFGANNLFDELPERALQSLKRIQHHRVSINGAPPMCGVSSMTAEQNEVLTALKVKQPSQFKQLSLL